MAFYHTPDTGNKRVYIFRRIQSRVIKFHLDAPNDGAICLTTGPHETPGNMFEIFLYAWNRTKSGIRKNKKTDVCQTLTPDLLKNGCMKGFWIQLMGATIKVGIEGTPDPFLTYNDNRQVINAIKFYGYSTGYGAAGKWTFADEVVVAPTPSLPPSPSLPVPAPNVALHWAIGSLGYRVTNPVSIGAGGCDGRLVASVRQSNSLLPGYVTGGQAYVCTNGRGVVTMQYYVLSNPGNVDLCWSAASGGQLPVGAIQGGYSETREPLYIGRTNCFGSYVGGKVHPSHKVLYFYDQDKERSSNSYEVLCLKKVPLAFLGLN